ncbi:MAG: hypothetical protein HY652_08330 [Acidobacteria bacterium]|nr:hypothetical protein [Acidobacteriota bacterium]
MKSQKRVKRPRLSEEAIDAVVVAEADQDSAWGPPMRVKRSKRASLSLPGELAARASFLARLHREANVDQWLKRIIRERIEIEEVAFAEAKKELAKR